MVGGMGRARRVIPRDVTLRWLDLEGEQFALFEWPIAPADSSSSPRLVEIPPAPVASSEASPARARPRRTPATDLSQLSPAERAVLAYVIRGDSNAEIAAARRTSVRTVANQVAKLLRKLGASSRFDLIRWFGHA